MKRTIQLGLLCAFLLGVLSAGTVSARPLSAQDKEKIECAMFRMQVLGNFFNVELPDGQKSFTYPKVCGKRYEGKEVTPPDWFPEELKEMEKLKVVYIPTENATLSEATLWYRTISNVYAYLDRANNALDPRQPVVFAQLSRGYVKNRIQLVANLDRLNKELVRGKDVYNMKDSMQGRARAMLATLELMNREFYSTIESFTSADSEKEDKYRQSVMAVVTLANQLWSEFKGKPLPMNPPDPKIYNVTDQERLFNTLLLILGSVLMGFAVYLLFDIKHDEIMGAWDRKNKKSTLWADDFNRQFLTIDVKYIVFGTIGVFALFGLMMAISTGGFGGVVLFLICLAIGAYVGIKMPKIVLDKLKKSRGVKINAQLMDALILLSNSLRSGMDIVQGFELVSHDMRPPIADEFGLVIKNYQLGTPFEKALEGMDERVDSRMLSYTIKAIIIQRQVGGNLTVIFARLVENIREESKLEEKLDAMTAQQKIQALVVGIMPVVMLGVMFMFRPDEMIAFYTTFVGLCVLLFCFVWIMIGMALIQKLGEVKV